MLGLNLSASVRPTNAWWTPGAIFAADFVNDRYMRDGVNISRDAALTVTRPSPKLARTLAGEWLSFPPNTLARTDRGASIEPASTNYVQNSTMAGAIPGAPGTAPTGWTVPTSSNGLVRQITAVGTSKGLPHIDIRFSGTTTAESFLNLYLCPGYVPTLPSDSWSLSCNIALIAGSLSGLIPTLACRLRAAMLNASSSYIGELMADPTITFDGGEVMQVQTATVTNSTVRFLSPYLQFWYMAEASVDFTIRIVAPQLERSLPTSPVLTSAGISTRQADTVSLIFPVPSPLLATYWDNSTHIYFASALPYEIPYVFGGNTVSRVEAFPS